jgi:coatomer protein complex subunit alpha (xenin)
VLELSEKQGRNAVKIDYDERTAFEICAASLTPVYKGQPVHHSPYSGAAYAASYNGSVCVIDGMAAVGTETLGLVCSSVQARTK